MKYRYVHTIRIAGNQEQARTTGRRTVPWWARLAVALVAATVIAGMSLLAAHAQEVTSGRQSDVLAASTIKHVLFAASESTTSTAAIVIDSKGNLQSPNSLIPQSPNLQSPAY